MPPWHHHNPPLKKGNPPIAPAQTIVYPRRVKRFNVILSTGFLLAAASRLWAQDSSALPPVDTRYGLFDLLDNRSAYGQGVYPEPFLVDDSDLEVNEARFDWLHTENDGSRTDLLTTEVEKGFGLLTLELEVHYEVDSGGDGTISDFDNVDLGARYPLYQYVSPGGLVDSTIGAGVEAGIPVNSVLSKNAEFVPKVFDDLKLGDHFTLQSIFGLSKLYGSGDVGGLETFEYGFDLGWSFRHQDLPLPGVQQLVPIFELAGETEMNKDTPGHNSLLGNAGLRADMTPIAGIQPRLGLGFVFPVDTGARQDQHWGVFTSLVFEY